MIMTFPDCSKSYLNEYKDINEILSFLCEHCTDDNNYVLGDKFIYYIVDEEIDQCSPEWALNDNILADFDDNFPVPSHITNEDDRLQYILQLLKDCYKQSKSTKQICNNTFEKPFVLSHPSYGIRTYGIKKEKLVNNALVVFLGISKYIEGFSEIQNVCNDEYYYKNIFQRQYNYKFISNNYKSRKWTPNEIIKYFLDVRKEFINFNNDCINYNGLILCISGHHTNTHLICSNGDKLSLKYIKSLFCHHSLHKNINNIPKLFIIDSCRDHNINNNNNIRFSVNQDDYSTTIVGSTQYKPVYDSLLAKCISSAFESCINNPNKIISFSNIYKLAYKKLFLDTVGRQQLTLHQHNYDIDNIIFIPQNRIINHMCTQHVWQLQINDDDFDLTNWHLLHCLELQNQLQKQSKIIQNIRMGSNRLYQQNIKLLKQNYDLTQRITRIYTTRQASV